MYILWLNLKCCLCVFEHGYLYYPLNIEGASRRMENFIDFDQASCEKSGTPLCQHLNEMYWEKRASESCMTPKSSNILFTKVEGLRIDGSPCDLHFSSSNFDFPSIEQVSSKRPPFNKGATNISILSHVKLNHKLLLPIVLTLKLQLLLNAFARRNPARHWRVMMVAKT